MPLSSWRQLPLKSLIFLSSLSSPGFSLSLKTTQIPPSLGFFCLRCWRVTLPSRIGTANTHTLVFLTLAHIILPPSGKTYLQELPREEITETPDATEDLLFSHYS